MGYYRPVKVVASGSRKTIPLNVVVVSSNEPKSRNNGDALYPGDFWWNDASGILSVYVSGEFELVGITGTGSPDDRIAILERTVSDLEARVVVLEENDKYDLIIDTTED